MPIRAPIWVIDSPSLPEPCKRPLSVPHAGKDTGSHPINPHTGAAHKATFDAPLSAQPNTMNTQDIPRWKQALQSVLNPGRVRERREAELAETMRTVCHELIGDLPLGSRLALSARIDIASKRHDLYSLRACMFDAISMQHGEQVARERLSSLDSRWP
jgi:hypothetical protein